MEENNVIEDKMIFQKDYVDKQLKFINSTLTNRNYALVNSIPTLSAEMQRPRRIKREQIRRAVNDPYNYIETLQQASMLLKDTNGIYKRVILQSAYMHTNDYVVMNTDLGKSITPDKLRKSYYETLSWLERLNIKPNAGWIKERCLEQGELYMYIIEDGDYILLLEIPNILCRTTSVENGVHKFAINLKKLNDDIILSMPPEIQKIYKRFKAGSIKEKDMIDRDYYELKDNAVAFNLDKYGDKGVPFFCTIFDDLMELEDMKDLKSENAIIESIKLIHQKYPIDKDTGETLIDHDVLGQMHRATKETLPNGTSITTNPLDLQSISLSDNNSKINNNVANSLENVYDSAGINMELFNGKKNSNEAIASGIISDAIFMKPFNDMIENWVNYELRKRKKNGLTWKIKLLDTTEYNKTQRAKDSREAMAYGGSAIQYMATEGYTPLQAISMLEMEKMLGIGELMIPKQTAHTLGSEGGSPTKAETGNTNGGNSVQPSNETR